MLSQTRANELFTYVDGALYRKKSLAGVRAGLAGGKDAKGYFRVRIDGERFLMHKIIFLMHTGNFPHIIDHKDGNPSNNRIENLREATSAQNAQNSALKRTNTSGAKGVSWFKASKQWRVQVNINKRVVHCGYFEDFELAELVAIEARAKHYGGFARHA